MWKLELCVWKELAALLCAGMEMFYEMYSPVIQKIEVLRLEKRLDGELLYLRDALPEYSTFPLDMEPEILPDGAPVPVNPIKVSNSTIIKQGDPKLLFVGILIGTVEPQNLWTLMCGILTFCGDSF